MENFTIFHVKVVEKFNWTALRYILHVYEVEKYNWITLGYFMPTKWKIGKFLNKNLFQVDRCERINIPTSEYYRI